MSYFKAYCARLVALLLTLAVGVGCTGDLDDGGVHYDGSDAATLRLFVEQDPGLISKSGGEVSYVYAIEIRDEQGQVAASYPDHTALPTEIKLRPGSYEITAVSGEEVAAGYNTPLYSDEASITLEPRAATQIFLSGTLQNTKVSLTLPDELLAEYPTIEMRVSNGETDGELLLSPHEGGERSGYFSVTGTLTWALHLVNGNGSTFNFQGTIEEVAAREHHLLDIQLSTTGGIHEGGVSGGITADGTLNEEQHTITIYIGELAAPALSGEGFTLGELTSVSQGSSPTLNLAVVSEAGLEDLLLEHNSVALESAGIPRSISLISGDATALAAMQAAGMSWSAEAEAHQGSITLGALMAALPLGDYELSFTAIDRYKQFATATTLWRVLPDTEVALLGLDPWALFIDVEGRWNTLAEPEGFALQYKKASESEWTTLPYAELAWSSSEPNRFTARLTTDASTPYQVRLVTTGEPDNAPMEATTGGTAQLPGMNFDQWFKDGKSQYVGIDHATRIWDSGNEGANTLSENNTTYPETGNVVQGTAAKLQSKYIIIAFAAGSLFVGDFVRTIGTSGAELNWGTPYTDRPLRLTGYYNYSPGTINRTKDPYGSLSGQPDIAQIYVVLGDWDAPVNINTSEKKFLDVAGDPHIIAYGSLESNQSSGGYLPFSIELAYRSGRTPKYAMIVASASKYGDYFTGSDASVLLLDEFQFEFTPE